MRKLIAGRKLILGHKLLLGLGLVAFPLLAAHAEETILTASVFAVTAEGNGALLGSISVLAAPPSDKGDPSKAAGGIILVPHLAGLPPGEHGFHLHAGASCAPGTNKEGQTVAGLAAGGHFDPQNTTHHEGPLGHGHLGDLPALVVAADGTASKAISAPHLTLADVTGHALVIHAGGDTYSDTPAFGGGGARIACGTFK